MSKASRKLQPGDWAVTDYNGRGMTLVKIITRTDNTRSQSSVLFTVEPALKNCTAQTLLDADWFEPAPEQMIKEYSA
jgi:hypothetical protein